MLKNTTRRIRFGLTLTLLLTLLVVPTLSQDANRIALDINAGIQSSIWQIQGEPTLVMNGFDLIPTPLRFPVVIENITIDIFVPQANELVDVVVYQDPNGGSPVDAELVATTQVTIRERGEFTVQFPEPVIVDASVVWIGFKMPVGMEFRADRQGSSVLTYWAWTPDSRFDLRDLSTAQVFGPSDGTSPVNIALGGVARIRAEALTADAVLTDNFFAGLDQEIPLNPLDFLINYSGCPTLFKDESDITISNDNRISSTCREVESWNAPRSPSGLIRRTNARGVVYDVAFFDSNGNVISEELPFPVTHCVTPALDEQPEAVVGLAYGAPRRWELLPSERFDNLVCAEIRRGGGISYFTPN